LLLLVQVGATGAPPQPAPLRSATATPSCARPYHVAFVTDVGGLRADGDAYRGMTAALSTVGCGKSELISSLRPSEYEANLRLAAGRHPDLVVAASFLLTDAAVDAARADPHTDFLLVDPILSPPGLPNLETLRFRQDQSAFLAGALAAMLTETGVVAGVYGPGGLADQQQRAAFEHGAHYGRPAVQVLGAYQPAGDGAPYDNPRWGAAQAEAFSAQRADVIFGGAGATGIGALEGAAIAGQLCIGASPAPPDPSAPSCLIGRTTTSVQSGVELAVLAAGRGSWRPGSFDVGLAEGAVGLQSFRGAARPDIQRRLQGIVDALVGGTLTTGV
jgi:basic membrane protein A and related proteins